MNCQTYRQHCTLEPNSRQPDFLSHKQNCSDCAAFTKDMMWFDQTLVEAMKVDIPDGLSERILQQQSNNTSAGLFVKLSNLLKLPPGWQLGPIMAFALMIIGVFTALWWWQADTIFLKREIITYVENTAPGESEVPQAELRGMFKAIGAQLTGEIGQVNFCGLLTLRGHNSAHIVLNGTKGPINVLFIRDSQMRGPQNISDGELKGIILSMAWGNIAIIGSPEEPLDKIAERINEGVIWL